MLRSLQATTIPTMRISKKVRYAVWIMIDLAQQDGERANLHAIAERQEINEKYCEAIIAELRAAGLVSSIRGRGGGYMLGRPAAKIRVGDIVRAVSDLYVPSDDPRDAAIEKGVAVMQAALDRMTLRAAAGKHI